jgi:molecular chaperone GrpE
MTESSRDEGRGDDQPEGAANDGAPGGSPAEAAADGSPEQRIAALEAERNELKDRWLRLAAEFENWKKRARKEQSDAENKARESVLRDMLEVVDNLERATSAQAQSTGNGSVDPSAVLKGVNLVLRLLQQKLERYDVRAFDSQGQPFDPRQHEAISRIENAEVPSGAVAVELQKGYRVGDRLLRPAMVSVSTGPKASAEPDKEPG